MKHRFEICRWERRPAQRAAVALAVFVTQVGTIAWLELTACVTAQDAVAPPAAAPSAAATASSQDPRRIEMDRLQKAAQAAANSGNLDEAIRLAQQHAELESQQPNPNELELISTWNFVGHCAAFRDNWETAIRARDEVLRLSTKVYGKDDYRVTDARVAREDVTRLQQMTAAQRKRCRELPQENARANELSGQLRNAEAEELGRTILADFERLVGSEHPEVANCLFNLALMDERKGNYAAAQSRCERAIQICEKSLGAEHPRTATCLDRLGRLHRAQANYAAAEPVWQRSLKIREKVLGPEHADTSISVINLAWLHQTLGNYAAAEPLYLRGLQICEKVRGPEHPQTANAINNLAVFYELTGDHVQAEPLFQRSLKILEQNFGVDHPRTAGTLDALGRMAQTRGDYAAAEVLLLRALEIGEKARGPEHLKTAISLNNVAMIYEAQGNYAQAESLLQRVVTIHEKIQGPEHPETATSLSHLAKLHQSRGNYVTAESLSKRALRIKEKALGPEHPEITTTLVILGLLYRLQGNYAAAEPLFQRALEIQENNFGPDNPDTAACLDHLAELHVSQKNYADAEPLYRRSLQIREKSLGPEHPHTAISFNNLARLYDSQDNYAAAEPLYQRSLQIREKCLTPEHPDIASSLNGLARMRQLQKDYQAAESLYRRMLLINEKTLGSQHPATAAAQHNLAILYWLQLDVAQARPLVAQSMATVREQLEQTAAIQSEQQQFLMAQQSDNNLSAWLSIGSRSQSPTDDWTAVIPWKGLITARQTLLRRDLKNEPLLAEHRQATQRLSRVALSPPAYPDDAQQLPAWETRRTEWLAEKTRLEQAHEQLEKALASRSADFAKSRARQQVTADQITACLAQQQQPTALIDLYCYRHWVEGETRTEESLAAYVARGDGRVARVNLGNRKTIDVALKAWRSALGQGVEEQVAAQTLRERLWLPLEAELQGIEIVLISPDGPLAGLPWAALPGATPGTYLIEEKSFAVIPIPQFIPELTHEPARNGVPPSLLLAGDIDYGGDPGQLLPQVAVRAAAQRGGPTRQRFGKLAAAQTELLAVEKSFNEASRGSPSKTLSGRDANESQFCDDANQFAWLHVITHGYFAPGSIIAASRSTGDDRDRPTGPAVGEQMPVKGEHPGLLSGLAFAGANSPLESGKQDGILTAMEVEGMDLSRVETVVLSACETGLGEVAGGEGVLGLQRAFQVAGAKTVIASLWKVDDAGTQALMTEFYQNVWEKKLPKLQALREAQLTMMRHYDAQAGEVRGTIRKLKPADPNPPVRTDTSRTAPYYWAAFMLSGDWR